MENFNLIIIFCAVLFLGLVALDIYWILKWRKLKNIHKEIVSKLEFAPKHKVIIKKAVVKPLINLISVIVIGGIGFWGYTQITPKIISSTPATEGIWESYSKPLEVYFNMPVDTSRLYVNMNPDIKGEWKFVPYLGIKRLSTYGYFEPQETLMPGQRVVVYITGIGRVGFRTESHEYGFVFDSVKLPEIVTTNPVNDSIEIDVNSKITLNLNKENEGNTNFSFKFAPEVEFSVEYPNSKQIIVKPTNPLDLSTEYLLQTFQQAKIINLNTKETLESENPILSHELKFSTKTEPLLRSYLPRGSTVKVDTLIKLKFVTDMVQESVATNFTTEPKIDGTITWDDSKTLIYTPTAPLEKETSYKVIVKNGIKNTAGIESENDINFEFKTIGFIRIQSTTPNNGEIKVSESADVRVSFNQEVDQASAQSKFSISPNISGQFSWDGNTLIFNPNGIFAFNTNYTVNLAPGIKSINGFDNTETLSFGFKTRTNEVIISMPLYYQPQYPVSFSCNIYAARMALAWKGYSTTVSGLIGEVGYDTRQDSNGKWLGDPNVNYVGNSDGTWGYGVHWLPVQKMFSNRGISTELKTGWNVADLARSIDNGKPVVIWRYNGTSADKNLVWGTPGIYAINGQHGGVVSGFRGTPQNPTALYINDPWFGLIWMDVNTFDYYWSRLGRVGLIVN
mgnify:CR=1 FL=1